MYGKKYLLLFTVFTFYLANAQDKSETDEEFFKELAEAEVSNVDESESLLTNVVSDMNKTLTNLYNHVTSANVTVTNSTESNNAKKVVKCKEIIYNNTDDDYEPTVELINGTQLSKLLVVNSEITSRSMEAECLLVFFHARACPFSAHAAPHFNALARAFPNVRLVALDALRFHGINSQYGVVGVPTLKMFHNGRPVGKFNGTEYNLQAFCRFVQAITGQQPGLMLVTSKDFQGPVSSVVVREVDYFLVLSWSFILMCCVYYFVKSKWCTMIVEMIQNNWREAEAQHEHND